VLKNTLVFVIQTAIMIFTLFFLFRDGARVSRAIVELIPMEDAHKAHILKRLNETLTAVVRGMFITASVQGLLAGIGFAVAGVRFRFCWDSPRLSWPWSPWWAPRRCGCRSAGI
jgi:predicted PurR-regulated permease PerM